MLSVRKNFVFVYEMGSSIFLVASLTYKNITTLFDGMVLETIYIQEEKNFFITLMKDVKKIDDFMNINFILSM